MTIRVCARIAGLAVLVPEETAVATHADELPKPAVWAVLAVIQVVGILWATGRRAGVVLHRAVPAVLTAVTVAAVWTTFAFTAPVIATGTAAALVAIAAVGPVVAAWSPRPAATGCCPSC